MQIISHSWLLIKKINLLLYVYECWAYIYVVPEEARKKPRILLDWSYKWL